MTDKECNPPRLAIRLLRLGCPGSNNEALAGDLVERLREGRSRAWFWRQVFIAIAVSVLAEIRWHWPHICYAIAGTVIMGIPSVVEQFNKASVMAPWWAEPWWLSALHSLVASPVLAVSLMMNGAFRWLTLLRTWIINSTLLALPPILVGVIIGPHIMSVPVTILVFFSTFFVSAWLGCIPPQHSAPTSAFAENRIA